jgi:hypothetical protein
MGDGFTPEAPNLRMLRLLTIDPYTPRPTLFVTSPLYVGRERGRWGVSGEGGASPNDDLRMGLDCALRREFCPD